MLISLFIEQGCSLLVSIRKSRKLFENIISPLGLSKSSAPFIRSGWSFCTEKFLPLFLLNVGGSIIIMSNVKFFLFAYLKNSRVSIL